MGRTSLSFMLPLWADSREFWALPNTGLSGVPFDVEEPPGDTNPAQLQER